MTNLVDIKKAQLTSTDIPIRFEAVAYFLSNSHPEVRALLMECRRNEKVRHIKMALDKAIHKLSTIFPQEIDSENLTEETDPNLATYLKNKAIDEVSGIFLHELAPQVGLLRGSLESELTDYENSQSKNYIEKITSVFQAIETLRLSTNRPNNTEIDLAQLLRDICIEIAIIKNSSTPSNGVEIIYEGTQPYILNSDASLLNLAISNAIRNSFESLESLSLHSKPKEDLKITIRWGQSDQDFWILIQDNGIGIKGNPKEAFKVGNTNKSGHTGFGMAIMQQAMINLGGYAELSGLSSGGAQLLLRWGNL